MQILKLNETIDFLLNLIENSQIVIQFKNLENLCTQNESDLYEIRYKNVLDAKEQIVSTLIDIDINDWDNNYLHIFQKLEWSDLFGDKALNKLNLIFEAEKIDFLEVKGKISEIIKRYNDFETYLRSISKTILPFTYAEENKKEENQQLLKVTYNKTIFIQNLEQFEKFCRVWNQIIYSFALLTHEENNDIRIFDIDSDSVIFHIGLDTTKAISKAIFNALIKYQKILEIKQLQISLEKLELTREQQIKTLLAEEEVNIIDNITTNVINELLDEYEWKNSYEIQNIYKQLQNSLKQTINFIEKGGYIDSSHFSDFKKINEKIIEIIKSIQQNEPDFVGFTI